MLAAAGLGPSTGGSAEALARYAGHPALSLDNLTAARERLQRAQLDAQAEQVLSWLPASGGKPLDADMRANLEAVLGTSMAEVRVFTGSAAGNACEQLNAHAFAIGTNIYFGSGEWAPGTDAFEHLLLHECQHVVQHLAGRLRGGGVSDPSDPVEVEAERVADRGARELKSARSAGTEATFSADSSVIDHEGWLDHAIAVDGDEAYHTAMIRPVGIEVGQTTTGLADDLHPDPRFAEADAAFGAVWADLAPTAQGGATSGASGAVSVARAETTGDTQTDTDSDSEEDDSLLAMLIAELFDQFTGGGSADASADTSATTGATGSDATGDSDAPSTGDQQTTDTATDDTATDAAATDDSAAASGSADAAAGGAADTTASGDALAVPEGGDEPLAVEPTASAPAVAEAEPTSASGVGREPDGVTDYYMEVHWDSEAFHTLGKDVGYPDGPSAVSEIDQLLPADTSPEVRAAINVAVAIGSGLLDDWVLTQACDYVGLPAGLVEGLVGLAKDVDARSELEDPVGMGLFLGLTTLEAITGGLEAVVDDVLEDCAKIQLALDALTVLSTTLGQVIALGASLLGPAGVAAVEAAILTIDGWCQGLHLALEVVRTPTQSIKAVIDIVQAASTTIEYVYNDYQANEAEAAGQFDKAAQYRDLARGMVIDQLLEWLSALKNVAFAVPMIGARGKEFEMTATVVASATRRVVTTVVGGDGGGGGMGAAGIANLIASELAKGTDWWHEVGLPGMQADTMRGGTMDGVDLGSGGGSTAVLDTARNQSIAWLDESGATLASNGPEWYQKLINEIANPPEAGVSEQTSPTYWIMEFMGQIPYVWELVKDGSLNGLAMGCDAVAEVLPLAQPFADEFTAMFNSIKPQLDEAVVQFDTFVQEQTVNLDKMEGMLLQLEEGIAAVDEMAAVDGEVDELLQSIIDTLAELRLDPGELALPSVVPAAAIDDAVAPINSLIDGAIDTLNTGKTTLIESLSETVSGITDALQIKLDLLQTSIAEGGSFRVELEAQVAAFKEVVHAATEAFLEMDGTIDIDCNAAAGWLSSVADACRKAAEEDAESPEQAWADILASTAQPAVDAWRSQYSDEVDAQYYPEVPPWELAAVEQVWAALSGRTDVDAVRVSSVENTYNELMSYRGQRGREALLAFWSLESEFVSEVKTAEATGTG